MNNKLIEDIIRNSINTTLVVSNKVGIEYAVNKIKDTLNKEFEIKKKPKN